MGTHTLTATWSDTLTIPADNVTPRSASSVNVPINGVGDNTKWLRSNLVTVHEYLTDDGDDPVTSYQTALKVWTSTSFVDLGGSGYVLVEDLAIGDELVIDVSTFAALTNKTAGKYGVIRPRVYEAWNGSSGTAHHPDGPKVLCTGDVGGAAQVSLSARQTIATAGDALVTIAGRVYSNTYHLELFGSLAIRVIAIRKGS